MKHLITIDGISNRSKNLCGGKAFNLAELRRLGFSIPKTAVLTTEAYHNFITSTGLREIIFREIGRKDFADMRWEELWDVSLRIKNHFIKTSFSKDFEHEMNFFIKDFFGKVPLAVRSSAPGEDSGKNSFAGLHESYVNLTEPTDVFESIKLVWASLWSVSSLLYRRELQLDPGKSSMAVVIQEMVNGDVSGVAFSVSPDRSDQTAVEAVYGLNQGMVDGTVEPDRWHVDRQKEVITTHFPASARKIYIAPSKSGTEKKRLPSEKTSLPPLNNNQVMLVARCAMDQETYWRHPRDTEWTFKQDQFTVLQSRPITSAEKKVDENKSFYNNLLSSFEELKTIRCKIENEILPAMRKSAENFTAQRLETLSNEELLENIRKRRKKCVEFNQSYWNYCIPFGHGIRLFGEIYNCRLKPDDPYEFVSLLHSPEILSVKRNRNLMELVKTLFEKNLVNTLNCKDFGKIPKNIQSQIMELAESITGMQLKTIKDVPDSFIKILPAYNKEITLNKVKNVSQQEKFFSAFKKNELSFAEELLDLARTSYKMRDDDNIFLISVKNELKRALSEAEKRLKTTPDKFLSQELSKGIPELHGSPPVAMEKSKSAGVRIKYRQLVGQPAGQGKTTGKARVVNDFKDLFSFKKGEIMVCDAVEPEMTFVAPLAAAIVERRGGMLIHGAIIAREYGLPCVTGVPGAAQRIKTGDTISVDGWLGIVTLDETIERR